MKYIYKFAAKAIIFNEENKLLLTYEKDGWSIPGGTTDGSEFLKETCIREVYEETGLEISVGKFLGISEGLFVDNTLQESVRYNVHYFLCTAKDYFLNDQWVDVDAGVIDKKFFSEEEFLSLSEQERRYINKSLFVKFDVLKNFKGEIFDQWVYNKD
jgi:8-oxo-dGTP diphosphatase